MQECSQWRPFLIFFLNMKKCIASSNHIATRSHIFLKCTNLVNNFAPSSIFSPIVILGLVDEWVLRLYNELPKGQAVSLQRQAKIPAKAYASLQHEDGSQWLWNLCNQLFLRSAVNRQYQHWENIKHLTILHQELWFFRPTWHSSMAGQPCVLAAVQTDEGTSQKGFWWKNCAV